MHPGFNSESPRDGLHSGRRRPQGSLSRRSKSRRYALENLEPRTLLATIPVAEVVSRANVSNPGNFSDDDLNESSPSVAVSPVNPSVVVSSWTTNFTPANPPATPITANIALSTDGGLSWNPLFTPPVRLDPTTSDPVEPYSQVTDASVAIDRDGNIFLLTVQRNDDNSAGEVILSRYNPQGLGRVDTTVYQWDQDDDNDAGGLPDTAVLHPDLAIDDTAATFTDVDTGDSINNPHAGNIYITWIGDTPDPGVDNWNPLTVELVSSTDGGFTFTAPLTVNAGGNFGDQRNTTPRLAISQGTFDGLVPAGLVTVVWDDFGTGAGGSPPVSIINSRGITDGGTTLGPQTFVTATTVLGNQAGGGQTASAATPLNIGASPVIASDNTLGSFSGQQGRLYIAYVDRLDSDDNPADNTDISLAVSDNGGASWTVIDAKVNDDSALVDGFSESSEGIATGSNALSISGRPQFEPEIAVDPATGTLVLSWFDARYDASEGRVARYVTSSIDGGLSFSEQTFVNRPETAVDVATNELVILGPVPDNQSGGNPLTEGTFGFGTRQGLAVFAGNVYVGWSSNENAGATPDASFFGGLDAQGLLDTRVVRATIAAGPRAIVDETTRLTFNTPDSGTAIPANSQVEAEIDLDFTFEILDVDVQVDIAHDDVRDLTLELIGPDGTVIPLFNGDDLNRTGPQVDLAGTIFDDEALFQVSDLPAPFNVVPVQPASPGLTGFEGDLSLLNGQLGEGRYRLRVTNNGDTVGTINDFNLQFLLSSPAGGVPLTEDGTGTPEVREFFVLFDRPIDGTTVDTTDFEIRGLDANGIPVGLDPEGRLNILGVDQLGPEAFRIRVEPVSTPGTYSYAVGPEINDLLRSIQQTVIPGFSGTFDARTLDPTQVDLMVPDAGGNPTITSDIVVSGVPAGEVIGDVNVGLTIDHTWDGDLILTLISPEGTRVTLSDQNGFFNDNYTNTIFDDDAPISIVAGVPPYTGPHRPQSPLAALIGEDPNGTWQLEVTDVFVPLDDGTLREFALEITTGTLVTSILPGNTMDQDADAITGEPNQDVFSVPGTTSGVPFTVPNVEELPLIIPGPRVVGSQVVAGGGGTLGDASPNLVLNGTVSAFIVTFDRDIDPSSFTADDVIRIVGPGGEVDRSSVVVTALDARNFQIEFATRELSGSYQITIGSQIVTTTDGFAIDSDEDAGLEVLRGGTLASPTEEVTFVSRNVPVTLPIRETIESTIVVDESFLITDVDLQLNIDHNNVPDLTAELIAPDETVIPLFANVGNTGSTDDFVNTIFDDEADLSINLGGPPFSSRFRPQGFLSTLDGSNSLFGPTGTVPSGIYTLRITNDPGPTTAGVVGTLNSWRLVFQKAVPGNGLGEPVADRIQTDFRIFTMDPGNSLSSSTWTAVGPAPINNGGGAGRITGLAVDSSDPSGNTVFVGGAGGGVWKTNNFLTNDPEGPTWIPLLDQVATFGMNTGGIEVFSRNADPNQSIIFVSTGEGDTFSRGVGLLRSMDGGVSWELLDSLDNTLPFDQRGHELVGLTSFDVAVDPNPTPTGEVIIYAAFSSTGVNGAGGIYRSIDSGDTWELVLAGQATAVELDPSSGTVDVFTNPTGNLLNVIAAIRGTGVFLSPTQGTPGSWRLLDGGVGRPTLLDTDDSPRLPVPVDPPLDTPNGPNGRIVLAKPALTGDPRQDLLYSGWIYAAVATIDDFLDGIYLTKDYGQNWVKLRIPTLPETPINLRGTPSNDTTLLDYDPLGNADFAQGNFDIALTIDPTNPNIVYLGGTRNGQISGLIRIDATAVNDAHAFYLSSELPGGSVRRNFTTGPVTIEPANPADLREDPPDPLALFDPNTFDPRLVIDNPNTVEVENPLDPEYVVPWTEAAVNFTRNPLDPEGNSTFFASGVGEFSNTGAGVRWRPFDFFEGGVDPVLEGTTDVHRAISYIDPRTGQARLIFGDDQGVFTAVDDGTGNLVRNLGTSIVPTGSRNGNIQVTQLYFGASQPSDLSAQIAGALFYGQSQDTGFPRSSPDLLETGDINWNGPFGDGTGVATDQTGSGTAYQYNWPCCGGRTTDFFQVDLPDGFAGNGIGRTNGLLQDSTGDPVPDPQWRFLGGGHFAVNPINGDEIVISAPGNPTTGEPGGRLFRTVDGGLNWFEIRAPESPSADRRALAFGAPEDPELGNTADHIIAGDFAGRVFVTYDGGGTWTQINNGDLGTGVAIQSIATNPAPGSFEAYAVTTNGVYHIDNTQTGTWVNITNNLFDITHQIFGDPEFTDELLANIQALAVDWRYVIPNNFDNPPDPSTDPDATHPVIYVAGEGGVFVTYNDGDNWGRFPSAFPNSISTTPTPPGDGGGFPVANVLDLDLSLGHVERTTGQPRAQVTVDLGPDGIAGTADDVIATSPDLLSATTFGRGTYAIRLAPVIFPESLRLNFQGQRIAISPEPPVLPPTDLIFTGYSARSAFGNEISLQAFELDQDGNIVRLLNLAQPVMTDTDGAFTLQINASEFAGEEGLQRIGIQAVNQSGTEGNIAVYDVVLDDTAPAAPNQPDLQTLSDTGSSSFDNITSDRTPTFDISGIEPNATVQFFRNGTMIGEVVAGPGGGTVTITDLGPDLNNDGIPDGLPDSTYEYTALQIDQVGNQGPMSPVLMVVVTNADPQADPDVPDLIGETTPVVFGTPEDSDTGRIDIDNVTNDNTPTFLLNGTPGESVDLLRKPGGAPDSAFVLVGSVIIGANGIGVINDPALLPDGIFDYSARRGTVISAVLAVTIDRTDPAAPSAPDLVDASDTGRSNTDNLTNRNTPTFQITGVEPGATVLLRRDGIVVAESAPAGPSGIVNVTDPGSNGMPVSDGPHIYEAVQLDLAGNEGPGGDLLVVTIDSTPPVAPLAPDLQPGSDTGISNIDNLTGDTSPTFTIAGIEPDAVVRLIRDGAVVAESAPAGPAGTVTLTDPGILPDGLYNYTALQIDEAGNAGSVSAPLSIVVDATVAAPLLLDLVDSSDTGRSNTDNLTSDTSPTFTVNGIETNSTVRLFRDGIQVAEVAAGPLGGQVSLTDPGPAPQGNRNYTAVQIDAAGNISALSTPLVVTIDTIAPPAPSIPDLLATSDTGRSNTDNLTNDTTPTFDINGVEPGATVVLLRDGVVVSEVIAGPAATTVSITDPGDDPDGDGIFAPIPDGIHDYTALLIDAAGNVGLAGQVLAVTIDATAPDAPGAPDLLAFSDTGSSLTDNLTSDTSPSFEIAIGAVELGATVELLRDGLTVGMATVSPGDTLTLTDNGPVPDGLYTYTAVLIDVAGNISLPSDSLEVTVDTVPPPPADQPDLVILSDTGSSNFDNVTGDRSPTFDLTGLVVDSTVQLLRDGLVVDEVIGVTETFATLTDPGSLPDGIFIYTVRQIDRAGNVSADSPGLEITVTDDDPSTNADVPDLLGAEGVGLGFEDSDTGPSDALVFDTDNVTMDNTPTFLLNGIDGQLIELFRKPAGSPSSNFVLVGSITGAGTITEATPLADGTYNYAARRAGGAFSLQLGVLIDTVAPAALGTPDLVPSSDTGIADDDNITADTTPTFELLDVEPDATVILTVTETFGADPTAFPVTIPFDDPNDLTETPGVVSITVDSFPVDALIRDLNVTLSVEVDPTATETLELGELELNLVAPDGTRIPLVAVGDASGTSFIDTVFDDQAAGDLSTGAAPYTGSFLPSMPLSALLGTAPNGTWSLEASDRVLGADVGQITGFSIEIEAEVGRNMADEFGGTLEVTVSSPFGPGTYDFSVVQVDLAGNIGPVSPSLTVTLDDGIVTPAGLDLIGAEGPGLGLEDSDTGRDDTDNITFDTTPTLSISEIEGNATVQLFRDGVMVLELTADTAGGTVFLNDPTVLADGDYEYVVRQIDTAGNVSLDSDPITLTIDTMVDAPNAPDLLESSDTGIPDDNITNDGTPTFEISGVEPFAIVRLIRDGVIVAEVTADEFGGTVNLTDPGDDVDGDLIPDGVPDGPHTYEAVQEDLAGNISVLSDGLVVDIRPPAPLPPDLIAATDTGRDNTDDVTQASVNQLPTFLIAGAQPGFTVRLLRSPAGASNFVEIAQGIADANGEILLADPGPTFVDGLFDYVAEQSFTGVIFGETSAPTTITIDNIAPPIADAPTLTSESDTGFSDTDNITSDTTPTFQVAGVEEGSRVRLIRQSGALVGESAPADASGIVEIATNPSSPLSNGAQLFLAVVVDQAGNQSDESLPVSVIIDTIGPAVAPNTPDLVASSDTGRSTVDNITADRNPIFNLTGVSGSFFVELLRKPAGAPDADFEVVGRLDQPGSGQIQDVNLPAGGTNETPVLVPEGDFVYTARAVDAAGNLGVRQSVTLAVTIDNTSPVTPTNLRLQPESDTGSSDQDQLTNAIQLTFDVDAIEAGALVELFRDGVLVGSTIANQDGTASVIDPGLVPEGLLTYTVQQTDPAGNVSDLGLVEVTVDRVEPPTAPSVDLIAASDTGSSSTDNITADGTPTFEVTDVAADLTVRLIRDGEVVAERIGPGTITDETPVLDGSRSYALQLVDDAGNTGLIGATLLVTIDRNAAPPAAPDLQAASDTGPDSTDNVTTDTTPTFNAFVGVELLATVELLLNGEPIAQRVGPGPITVSNPLPSGTFDFSLRQTDLAGNASGPGEALEVTIESLPPISLPILDLQAGSDSGISNSDNITNITTPIFNVTDLLEEETAELSIGGTVVGQRVGPGPITLDLPLTNGVFGISARAVSPSGEIGNDGPILFVTIDTEAPVEPFGLDLLPGSDTGSSNTDNITSDRSPSFSVDGIEANATVELLRDGVVVGTQQGPGVLTDEGPVADGDVLYSVRQTDLAGNVSDESAPLEVTITPDEVPVMERAPADFDGDGITDLAIYVFDETTGTGRFEILRSTDDEAETILLGGAGDIPVEGDFDGDGISDPAVFSPSVDSNNDGIADASAWTIIDSTTGDTRTILFGAPGVLDRPAPADYDGDGVTDIATFRANSDLIPGAAEWFILQSSDGALRVTFGAAGGMDLPAPADFDGDGKADIATFRPVSDLILGAAQWFVRPSSNPETGGFDVVFGASGGMDQPVVADYNDDGFADIAAFRSESDLTFGASDWFILPSGESGFPITFGDSGSIAAPADYNNDGAVDLAVFDPESGEWMFRPVATSDVTTTNFGTLGGVPLLAPLAFRIAAVTPEEPGVPILASSASVLNNETAAMLINRMVGLPTGMTDPRLGVSRAPGSNTSSNAGGTFDLATSASTFAASSSRTPVIQSDDLGISGSSLGAPIVDSGTDKDRDDQDGASSDDVIGDALDDLTDLFPDLD